MQKFFKYRDPATHEVKFFNLENTTEFKVGFEKKPIPHFVVSFNYSHTYIDSFKLPLKPTFQEGALKLLTRKYSELVEKFLEDTETRVFPSEKMLKNLLTETFSSEKGE